jgi:CheY-like chemotaxis protein
MAQLATERPVVLIVEDEFLIRSATAEAIRDVGFEVVEAAHADAAILVLESRSDIRLYSRTSTCPDRWTARSSPTL